MLLLFVISGMSARFELGTGRENEEMNAESLWKEFCAKRGVDEDTEYEAWGFCGGGDDADELGKLVMEGKKFGTASCLIEYEMEEEDIPKVGEYSVLLDKKDDAYAVIQTVSVKVVPFGQVSAYHGYSEGEGKRDLLAWREIHKNFWAEDFEEWEVELNDDTQIVLEQFTIQYVSGEQELLPEVKEEDLFEDCYLIEASMRYADQITAYRQAFLERNDSMDGCLSLKRMPDPKEWVDYCIEWGNPQRNLGENGITGTLLMCIRKEDDKLVGMMQIHTLPETHPRNYVGHIGYSVLPEERRKGYASWMLKKGLSVLKYAYHEEKAVISVLPDNEASKKTILANGGQYMDTVDAVEDGVILDRYYIQL